MGFVERWKETMSDNLIICRPYGIFAINEVKKYVTIVKILIKMTWVCNSTNVIIPMYFGQYIFSKFCNVFIIEMGHRYETSFYNYGNNRW